jgi:hypothetical protein
MEAKALSKKIKIDSHELFETLIKVEEAIDLHELFSKLQQITVLSHRKELLKRQIHVLKMLGNKFSNKTLWKNKNLSSEDVLKEKLKNLHSYVS